MTPLLLYFFFLKTLIWVSWNQTVWNFKNERTRYSRGEDILCWITELKLVQLSKYNAWESISCNRKSQRKSQKTINSTIKQYIYFPVSRSKMEHYICVMYGACKKHKESFHCHLCSNCFLGQATYSTFFMYQHIKKACWEFNLLPSFSNSVH